MMAKPHARALRSIEVVSDLSADELVAICKEAADQLKIRLESNSPGRLVFSIRSMIRPDKNRLMIFEIRLGGNGQRHVLRSKITSYRTSQTRYLGLIPLGPRRLVGLPHYDQFMERLEELTRQADPAAETSTTG
jgi:hypothetical protein